MNAHHLRPPHEPRDSAKLAAIEASMRDAGWVGLPVLVWRDGEALTGSHRIAAARITGVTVETYVLSVEDEDVIYDLETASDDEDRLRAIEQTGDPTAIAIMRAEVANN